MCRFGRGMACAAALVVLVGGCGKGSGTPAGKSLTDQYNDAKKITDPEARARELIAVGQKQMDVKDSRSAQTTLKEAAQAIEALQGSAETQAQLYLSLASAWHRADGKREAAAALDAAAQVIAKIESVATQADKLAELAAQRATIGEEEAARKNVKEAEILLAKVAAPRDKVYVQAAMIRAYAVLKSQAEVDRMLVAAHKLAEDHPKDRVRIQLTIATTQKSIGQTEAAKGTLDKAVALARSVTDSPLAQANLLYESAEAANTIGQLNLCSQLLTDADTAAKKTPEGGDVLRRIEQLRKKLNL